MLIELLAFYIIKNFSRQLALHFYLFWGLTFLSALLLHVLLMASRRKIIEDLHLTEEFHIYTTYSNCNGQPFPSNSIYVATTEGVVLIDTPWDAAQFQPLLNSNQRRHGQEVVLCIATHFRADRKTGARTLSYQGDRNIYNIGSHKLSVSRREKLEEDLFTRNIIRSW